MCLRLVDKLGYKPRDGTQDKSGTAFHPRYQLIRPHIREQDRGIIDRLGIVGRSFA